MIGPVGAKGAAAMLGDAAKAVAKTSETKSDLAGFFREVVEGQEKMGAVMKEAFKGRQLSATEMLAVQAGIYRYSAELDLAARVVEKLSSGVKQTMNTQVG